jgi:hypothetical protein
MKTYLHFHLEMLGINEQLYFLPRNNNLRKDFKS